MMPNGHIIVII